METKTLYLYTDWQGAPVWAKDPEQFRQLTGRHTRPMRVAHENQNIPAGYEPTGRGLACDCIRRIDTRTAMKRLVNGL